MKLLVLLPLCLGFCLPLASLPARSEFQAGAAILDITPTHRPVIVNGGFFSRTEDTVTSRLHARALALSDGRDPIGIVVVDSCMLGRPLIDEVKHRAAHRTGIAPHRLLIAATHTHTAPASMSCLGTDADPRYLPYLRDRLVEVIATAHTNLEAAEVGWARGSAPAFTALRRWILRPDRLATDPFGNPTVRANMHAGRVWDDVTGESGPEDPDLPLISFRNRRGHPIAVLASFSMHYFGDTGLSADYFGRFCEGLESRMVSASDASPDAASASPGKPRFVGILAHGCSGDIYRVDYRIPEKERPNPTLDQYVQGLLDIAVSCLSNITHRAEVDLAMAERRLTLNYRVPDRQRLEWAERIVSALGDREPTTLAEVYAREQIHLHRLQKTDVVVQALRIGDIAIATTPTETYALTGLKIKAASPLTHTMVLDLANGGDGYIPPPEQHLLGGYNTWPARSAGLEITAEPKIAEAAIRLLEAVSGRDRRPHTLSHGPAALGILAAKPVAYWRLNEFAGPLALDATARARDAVFEPAVVFHLEGPRSERFCAPGEQNRAPHFAGGRLRARFPELPGSFSVSLWIWNGLPEDARDTTGWFFSRGPDHGLGQHDLHLGVGGRSGHPGRLVVMPGDDPSTRVAGHRIIPRWEWHHVALVHHGTRVRLYLDGQLDLDTSIETASVHGFPFFFGGRSDNDSNWEGRLDEIAVFDRALDEAEIATLAGIVR